MGGVGASFRCCSSSPSVRRCPLVRLTLPRSWVTGVDLHTNKLVSCSYDGTVRVWNTQTGNSLQTLPGELHGDDMLSPCWCVKFKGSQIMAGSSDSKVKQWDMNTAQLVRVFEGHAGGVKCLQVRAFKFSRAVILWHCGAVIRSLSAFCSEWSFYPWNTP